MIIYKSRHEIETMDRCNRVVTRILAALARQVAPGVTTMDLEETADRMIARLSELLRLTLDGSKAQEVPLSQELKRDSDTAETLATRVLEAEHHLYPHALALVASGAVFVKGERVFDSNDQAQVALFSPPLA